MATSKVAPPQHSRLKQARQRRARRPGDAVMSNERMRVASSDWCASRIVVSVTSTRSCAFIQRRGPLGPRVEALLRAGEAGSGGNSGTTRAAASAGGFGRSRTSGWPLTVTSAM
jgi:hypothetical protein